MTLEARLIHLSIATLGAAVATVGFLKAAALWANGKLSG